MTEPQSPPADPATSTPPIEPEPDTSWVSFDLIERGSTIESETRSGE